MVKKTCPECGKAALAAFSAETMDVEHKGRHLSVDNLSGSRCRDCGEVLFDADSAARYAAAGDRLVHEERERLQHEIRRIRRKLKLSQAAAAKLTGGGTNAFSRYETGAANPMPAVVNLLHLLDLHPELLREIRPAE